MTLDLSTHGLSMRLRRLTHLSCLAALGALPACGGGGGGDGGGGVVTPLDGTWDAPSGNTERIQFSVPTSIYLFASKFNVTGTVTTSTDVCGGGLAGNPVNVEGTIDDGHVLLRPSGSATSATCIDGRFTDLRTLRVAAQGVQPQRNYQNSRVDVGMSFGRWVSEGDGRLQLKFTEPDSIDNGSTAAPTLLPLKGCNVSSGTGLAPFISDLRGFNTDTGAKPVADALLDTSTAALVFQNLTYVDGGTITLQNAGGQSFTLHRQAEAKPSTCPPPPP